MSVRPCAGNRLARGQRPGPHSHGLCKIRIHQTEPSKNRPQLGSMPVRPLHRHAMKRIIIACVVVSLVSGYLGYTIGRRSTLNLSGRVTVYGCGVDRAVRVSSDSPVLLQSFMARLHPLPAVVNGALIQTTNGKFYCRLAEMSDTNGIGRLPLFGGEAITLVHRDD